MIAFIDVALLVLMTVTAFAVVRIHNLFAVVMLLGIFSFLAALLYINLDAVDVAFTEAAVGAGISTVLMLGTLALTSAEEKGPNGVQLLPLGVVVITGAALIYGTFDMPNFGDPLAPANLHVSPHYINESGKEVGPPNIVTSVLASYRGFDTLGEVVVVFTAGVGVMALIGRGPISRRRRRRKTDDDPGSEAGI